MEPVSKDEISSSSERIFQVKWDGIRLISYLNKDGLICHTKNLNSRNNTYPEINNLKKLFQGKSCILDGEIIAMSENGKPDFYKVLRRDRIYYPDKKILTQIPVNYIIFDILALNGKSFLHTPLEDRLNFLYDAMAENDQIKLIENIKDGKKLFNSIVNLDLEGIVSKEIKGLYYPGKKHPTWHKIKNLITTKAVLGGIIYNKHSHRPKSILSGIPVKENHKKLKYIGKVSIGLKENELKSLAQINEKSFCSSPFIDEIKSSKNEKIKFLPPKIQMEIKFLGWTPDNTMRAPVIEKFLV